MEFYNSATYANNSRITYFSAALIWHYSHLNGNLEQIQSKEERQLFVSKLTGSANIKLTSVAT